MKNDEQNKEIDQLRKKVAADEERSLKDAESIQMTSL